jgi:hypothetical protein
MLWTRWEKNKEKRKRKYETISNLYKINLLQDPSIRRLYQDRLNNYLKDIKEEEDIDTERNNITESIHKAAGEAIGKEKKSPKSKFKNLE